MSPRALDGAVVGLADLSWGNRFGVTSARMGGCWVECWIEEVVVRWA